MKSVALIGLLASLAVGCGVSSVTPLGVDGGPSRSCPAPWTVVPGGACDTVGACPSAMPIRDCRGEAVGAVSCACEDHRWACVTVPPPHCEDPCVPRGPCSEAGARCETTDLCPSGDTGAVECSCSGVVWACTEPACPGPPEPDFHCPDAPSTGDWCPSGSDVVCPAQATCADGSTVEGECACVDGRLDCTMVSCPDPSPTCPPSSGTCSGEAICDGPSTTCPDGSVVATHCDCSDGEWVCSSGVCSVDPPDGGGGSTGHGTCADGLTVGNPCSPSGSACDQVVRCPDGGEITRGCYCTRGTWQCDWAGCPAADE